MVFQRPPIFDGTVLDNLRVARADSSRGRRQQRWNVSASVPRYAIGMLQI